MSKVNELFDQKLAVVNFGIESFYQDQVKQNTQAVHVDWKPVAGGDKKIARCLKDPYHNPPCRSSGCLGKYVRSGTRRGYGRPDL